MQLKQIDPITLEILWGRLIGLVDEAAAVLVRSAFSTIARESNDFACVLLDAEGAVIAQTTQGVPQLAIVSPRTVRAILSHFDLAELRQGDVLFSNDPWLGAGHLPDFFTVMPIFRNGRIVAHAAAVSHVSDVGGALAPADAREVFEEGICFPPVRLFNQGKPNAEIFAIIAKNNRVPQEVIGDLNALVAADHKLAQELNLLMDEAGIEDLAPLSQAIRDRSEQSMRAAIRATPDGIYRGEVETDGHDHPNKIVVTLTVQGDEITADYTGTSDQVRRGINSVYNYSYGYTMYSLKCLLDPHTPNTEGSYRPIKVQIPKRSILNPEFPAPVYARNQTGHYLPAVIMAALSDALPKQAMAAAGTPPNRTVFAGSQGQDGRPYSFLMFTSGGMGALHGLDGLASMPFPSNAGSGSVEITENVAPITVCQKALRTDSGGAGRWRGGMGVELIVRNSSNETMNISTRMDRIHHPPEGLHGGMHGAAAGIWRNGDQPFAPKGRSELGPGESLLIRTAGGGGFGKPADRDREQVEQDLADRFISPEAARDIYGLGVKE